MTQSIDAVKQDISDQLKVANDMDALEDVRVKALGKKGYFRSA